ncbi:hypothetical protein JCM16161A_19640 [Vulcanisaeta sp. JCM 16161]|uniref:hypothetical protein n=1 Tax=Vulcanisaeta sp. JCM 16161 TaxID=1295372 RepID=UPI00406C15B3
MLSRITSIEEELRRHGQILEEHTRLLQEHEKTPEEHSRILEEHGRILREHTGLLQEHGNKLDEHGKILQSHSAKLDELTKDVQEIKKTLNQMNRTMQKLTYSIKDEAIDVISWKLRKKLGVDVKLSRLVITEGGKEVLELNIYGASGDLCVIGDATLDLRVGKVEELLKAIEMLRSRYPQYLRPRIVKVLYCMRYVPETIEEARRGNVWALTWREELTPLSELTN